MKRNYLLLVFLAVLIVVPLASAFPYSASDPEIEDALMYLESCQQIDGGFGEEGRESNPATTTWAVLAITAAGENPDDWEVAGTSATDYLEGLGEETLRIEGTAETAKMVITIVAAGKDPHDFHGTDFVVELEKKLKSNGQLGDYIYTTNWGIIALSAAGEATLTPVAWLKGQQNPDGGFGWAEGTESDSDDTASALMALIAGGEEKDSPAVKDALGYLRSVQMEEGGFNFGGSSASNSASDAWVIQALVAAGEDPSLWTKNGRSVVDHLLSHQAADGHFKWTAVLSDNPCRMTASAIPALLGEPFPIFPDADASLNERPEIARTALPTPGTTIASTKEAIPTEEGITITDDFGYTVFMQDVPERIVSLAPSNTEILFSLGLGEKVVGVTEYCNYPPEVESTEKVGGYSTVNIEKVVALHPDLVVAAFGNTEQVIDHLRNLGLTIISLNPQSIEDVLRNIELVGKATGKEAVANAMTRDLQQRIDAVTEKTASLAERPTVAHIIWYDPLWVSGENTFQEELIELAGGQNAFPKIEGWEIIGLEEFITIDPDIILVNEGTGMGAGGKDLIYENIVGDARLQNLQAVKGGRVYLVNTDMVDRGGPRIVDALEMVAADIHPELFTGARETAAPTSTPGFGIVAVFSIILAAALIRMRRAPR